MLKPNFDSHSSNSRAQRDIHDEETVRARKFQSKIALDKARSPARNNQEHSQSKFCRNQPGTEPMLSSKLLQFLLACTYIPDPLKDSSGLVSHPRLWPQKLAKSFIQTQFFYPEKK